MQTVYDLRECCSKLVLNPPPPSQIHSHEAAHSDPPDPRHPQEDHASQGGAPPRLWHKAHLEQDEDLISTF